MQASKNASASRSRKTVAAAKSSTSGPATSGTSTDTANPDAGELLKQDHRKVESLFAQYETLQTGQEKVELVRQICTELIHHTRVEEELFYPACRAQGVDDDELDEAQVEHDAAKMLIRELLHGGPDDEFYDAKVVVLSEQIKHHVREEEQPKTGIIAKAAAAGVDMNELGRQVQARKQELVSAAGRIDVSRPVSVHLVLGDNTQEEHTMASQYRRERDEQGRFMSDDDRNDGSRGGGRGGQSRDDYGRFESDDRGSGRYSRSRDDDDDDRSRGGGRGGQSRDDDGRFESDDRGSGRYSRSRGDDYDDRSRGGGGRGGQSRDDDGRFESDDRGASRYGRSRDDDDRGSRSSRDDDEGRGRGQGWFGDSRGHSEAAREGWRNRDDDRSSRSRSDDSRSSRSRDDDDRGYSRSRSRDDDDDGRGRGHGGWFGDPRGHAEAAREGWRNRDDDRSSRSRSDDSRSSRSSRDDDDDGRGRGHGGWFGDPRGHAEAAREGWRNRDDDRSSRSRSDDSRSSRSSRNDDDDGRGRGHGGWFGDPRGHAEAARRGWQNR